MGNLFISVLKNCFSLPVTFLRHSRLGQQLSCVPCIKAECYLLELITGMPVCNPFFQLRVALLYSKDQKDRQNIPQASLLIPPIAFLCWSVGNPIRSPQFSFRGIRSCFRFVTGLHDGDPMYVKQLCGPRRTTV